MPYFLVFRSVGEAKSFIDYLHERIETEERSLGLILDEACVERRNNYSLGSEDWREAEENSCSGLKEDLKREARKR